MEYWSYLELAQVGMTPPPVAVTGSHAFASTSSVAWSWCEIMVMMMMIMMMMMMIATEIDDVSVDDDLQRRQSYFRLHPLTAH